MTIIYYGSGGGVPRKTAKIFASQADTIDVTEFGSTLAGDTQTTTDIADIQNEAFEVGWRDAVISDENYPLMGDMNAVQKVASQQIAYTLQHGIPEYDASTTYHTYDLVMYRAVMYVSIRDNNTNNPVSDGDYWAVYYDPNASATKRDIGEMVFSLLPISSSDLHLADGALLNNNGIYVEFCQYIASLYNSGDYDSLFVSEAQWQASVNTYGVCGKFVYDSVNGTVRLPKITGVVEGTLDATALGDLTTAGLPPITHTHIFSGTTSDENATHSHSGTTGGMNANVTHNHSYVKSTTNYGSGVPAGDQYTGITNATTGSANIEHGHGFTTGTESAAHQHNYGGETTDNSSINNIYGNSTTVQPQTIKGYYYIAVANTVATDYTIQLDNIVTDLADKASVDLDNLTQTGKDKIAVKQYTTTETYMEDDVVLGYSDEQVVLYKSLIDNNINNPLTDTAKWEVINLGGSSRNVGEIVTSAIPLTDAGLHLLDGSLILGGGIYDDFVNYIADLTTDYPDLFETEANWQTAVSTYGVCGKFVYDSVNGTVRLPKITGIVEGTTDLTALGDLVQAGLPNITGNVTPMYRVATTTRTGAFSGSSLGSGTWNTGGSGSDVGQIGIKFNASNSNSIYGNSTTVQPQTIKVLFYICIATATKTNIEVDIDEIATDLNGKLDLDATNATVVTKNTITNWAFPSSNQAVPIIMQTSGTTYPAPFDGWFIYRLQGSAAGTCNTYNLTADPSGDFLIVSAFYNAGEWRAGYIPVKKGDYIMFEYFNLYFTAGAIAWLPAVGG